MEKKIKHTVSDSVKVVLFGPESTGKTTLAKMLARHYQTKYVSEYSREYTLKKHNTNETLNTDDVINIVKGQLELEQSISTEVKPLMICDTDVFETKVYSELYYPEKLFPVLEKYAKMNTCDLYFLTYIDTPWEEDFIRDRPDTRAEDFKVFEDALIAYNKPYIVLKGNKSLRFETAVKHIDQLIKQKV